MIDQPANILSWNLRQARLSDLEAIHSLYVQTIECTCKNDYDQPQRNVWKQGIENTMRWEQATESQYFLVAENSSGILGFGSLKDHAHVDFLFTHKDHLRKGIADQIYRQLEKHAAGHLVKEMTADVSITARAFFEKQGFKLIKENQNIIREFPIINYTMHKTLVYKGVNP